MIRKRLERFLRGLDIDKRGAFGLKFIVKNRERILEQDPRNGSSTIENGEIRNCKYSVDEKVRKSHRVRIGNQVFKMYV